MKRPFLPVLCLFLIGLSAAAQSVDVVVPMAADAWSMAVSDILETLAEHDPDADLTEVEEQLADLQRNPVDLNSATEEDLEQLFWLTPEQRDAILLYVYHQPMQTVYELQLVRGLQEWDIRNMLPFITVVPRDGAQRRSLADCLRMASHSLDFRLDARNLEQFSGDPIYGQLRYSLDGGSDRRGIRMGAVFKRDAGEIPDRNSRYGAYLQINDLWRFRTIVAGDYRASFGLGLVMNAAMPMGKPSMASNLGMNRQGLRKYGGASDDFLRGAGAVMRFGSVDLTAFYSCRMPRSMAEERLADSGWGQTAGMNLTYRRERLKLGLTAVNYWQRDSLRLSSTYYNGNYWRGSNQFSASLFFQYGIRRLMLFGEAAASQNTTWGAAGLLGARFTPVQDLTLMALLRCYSPTYDARFASAFGETSRANDEHGVYLGADITRISHWRFSLYSDFFCFTGPKYQIRDSLTWGYDLFAQAAFLPSDKMDMRWRVRAKRKGQKDLYSLRFTLDNHLRRWSFRTQADANICRPDLPPLKVLFPQQSDASMMRLPSEVDATLTWGLSVFHQVEYRAARVPLVAQFRVQGFYVPHYDNRIYSYENDVLYAFSLPMVYGIGARYYANLRYRISDHLSVYFRASDTWYTADWATTQNKPSHKTDIHLLLRLKF